MRFSASVAKKALWTYGLILLPLPLLYTSAGGCKLKRSKILKERMALCVAAQGIIILWRHGHGSKAAGTDQDNVRSGVRQ
jgi:hypothetical protein